MPTISHRPEPMRFTKLMASCTGLAARPLWASGSTRTGTGRRSVREAVRFCGAEGSVGIEDSDSDDQAGAVFSRSFGGSFERILRMNEELGRDHGLAAGGSPRA